ncbi:amidase family protein [Allokutzneria albata]|uniref:Aspartyl-tRNA(Asn)/glutamyl-tRNA(Gln) amidotransferase subunit A n=1 Tax=Allokutzneria albata TaxID=211114 RepID=A0A1G9Y558_ALLAB|nr:amidase family protein [Allokutzneria albata]SDN03691.1 aspartyl-tRNA(Asn)/glutamyl-tRNA(Gln) amidotransferase subunit A [Allokutzneria albata]
MRWLDSAPSGTFITMLPDRALREAEASDRRHRASAVKGPLDGIPLVWKDNFDLEGTVTSNGSPTRANAEPASTDAPVVARLAAAGAVSIGKTNLSEFAFTGLGLNPHFGNPVNPLAPDRVPGGSSSGSAVAVAAGVAEVGIGSDTSGSIRVPAAFCGVIGYRPSTTRYDRRGMQPLSPQLDSVGVLARSMYMITAVDAVLRSVAPVRTDRPRLVIPLGELTEDCSPEITDEFESVAKALEKQGFPVIRKRLQALEDTQRLIDEHGPLVLADAYRAHGHLRASTTIDPLIARRLSRYEPNSEKPVLHALPRLKQRVQSEVDDAVLLFPTTRDPAPTVESVTTDLDVAEAANRRVLRSTMLTSHLDMPGVALGNVLLSATTHRDDLLLATATEVERHVLPHQNRRKAVR